MAIRAAGAVGTRSPTITHCGGWRHHLEAHTTTANCQALRGFEWTKQYGVSPADPVTDPSMGVAGGEASGAHEGQPKGLEEGDDL